MFWKKDKNHSSSLASRLIALYSLSTIGIMLVVSLFFYPTINNLLQHSTASASLTVECFKNAIIALLFVSLGAVILGYVITKNSLRKIDAFSNKMRTISADSLHERIDPNYWPAELKALADDFNVMLDRLEKNFLQLSQFSSDISHELRNPLHHLMTSTEITLGKEQSTDAYKQLLTSHLSEYEHLSRLISNLLFLAKADHGQLQIDKTVFFAQEEIENACDYFQALADEKNIIIHCQGNEEILADKILFRRVIVNALSNAIQYTPNDGSINISVIKTNNNAVSILVNDTGIGIHASHIDQIFDRFYRADASRSTNSGSLGLGLAIVKSIIELHGGSVQLKSQLNQGTSLFLCFPSGN